MHPLTALILAEREALAVLKSIDGTDPTVAEARLTALEEAAFLTLPVTEADDLEAIVSAALTDEMPARPVLRLVAPTSDPDTLPDPGDRVAITQNGGYITTGIVTNVDGFGIQIDAAHAKGRMEIGHSTISNVLVLDPNRVAHHA